MDSNNTTEPAGGTRNAGQAETLSGEAVVVLEALVERLIPSDEVGPGAREARVHASAVTLATGRRGARLRIGPVATVCVDGAATATPVWAHVDGRHILVNTGAGRLKERNVRRDPRLALALVVPDDPYSWVEIRGRVVEFVEGLQADKSFADFARKYLGYAQYASPIPGEARVLLRIEPTRVGFRTEPGVRPEGGRA